MLALVFIGAAFVPVAVICWVLTWLMADAVGGGARPVLASVRVRNRRWAAAVTHSVTDTDYTRIGPAVGEPFPDFELTDAHGSLVRLDQCRNGRQALVVFYRSAAWWPFCKAQLVELQKVQYELESRGIGLIAISYDGQEVLRQFAEAKGIKFPLLSDVGSRVITELGLLDRDLTEHHAAFGIQTRDFQQGVAYPAVFVLDESGRVLDKRIGESYRAREGALKLLEEALGVALTPMGERKTAAANHVIVTAVSDSPTFMRWQETRLHVLFDVDQGWHVYGLPIPDGYIPLTVEVTGIPELEVHAPQFPPTRPFKVESLNEQFHVYEGHFEVIVPFAIKVAQGHGTVDLKVTVRYQTCSETECMPPASLAFELRLEESPPA